MSPVLQLSVVAALFILLHIAAWKATSALKLKSQLLIGGASLLICLPGLWFVIYYLHILPEPPLLYQLRSLEFSEGFLSIFGIACGVWRSILPKLLKPLPTAAGAFLLFIPFIKPVLHRLDPAQLTDSWRDGVCLQSSVVTCGPAAAASILRSFGDEEISERELAQESWTSESGTEAWHLARALRRRGYRVRFLAPKTLPNPADLPGILGTGAKRAGHFISILEISDSEIRFADPLRGMVTMTIHDFNKWMEVEPFFMSIKPTN